LGKAPSFGKGASGRSDLLGESSKKERTRKKGQKSVIPKRGGDLTTRGREAFARRTASSERKKIKKKKKRATKKKESSEGGKAFQRENLYHYA